MDDFDLSAIPVKEEEDVTPLESLDLLAGVNEQEEQPQVEPKAVIKTVNRGGRPTNKKPGVIYKPETIHLPEGMIDELTMFRLINKKIYKSKGEIIEEALNDFFKKHK